MPKTILTTASAFIGDLRQLTKQQSLQTFAIMCSMFHFTSCQGTVLVWLLF